MNLEIAELANHDLRNASRVLYYSTNVLRKLPHIDVDNETKAAIYASAKLAIHAVQRALANITHQIDFIEATEELAQ